MVGGSESPFWRSAWLGLDLSSPATSSAAAVDPMFASVGVLAVVVAIRSLLSVPSDRLVPGGEQVFFGRVAQPADPAVEPVGRRADEAGRAGLRWRAIEIDRLGGGSRTRAAQVSDELLGSYAPQAAGSDVDLQQGPPDRCRPLLRSPSVGPHSHGRAYAVRRRSRTPATAPSTTPKITWPSRLMSAIWLMTNSGIPMAAGMSSRGPTTHSTTP